MQKNIYEVIAEQYAYLCINKLSKRSVFQNIKLYCKVCGKMAENDQIAPETAGMYLT